MHIVPRVDFPLPCGSFVPYPAISLMCLLYRCNLMATARCATHGAPQFPCGQFFTSVLCLFAMYYTLVDPSFARYVRCLLSWGGTPLCYKVDPSVCPLSWISGAGM